MRGTVQTQSSMFVYLSLEERVPSDHVLRPIKSLADEALASMDRDLERLYKPTGRKSVPPEQLLKATLLQILFGIRSERQLVEQIEFNILYRWFLDLDLDASAWDATTFTHNRDRLLTQDIAKLFLARTVELARTKDLVSSEHFSVDGTLLQAWASHKSLVPIESPDGAEPAKDAASRDIETDPPAPPPPTIDDVGSEFRPKVEKDPESDFRGQKLSNATHRSKTDPDSTLYRKSNAAPAKLAYLANALIENRNGLVVQGDLRKPAGEGGETASAEKMLGDLGGDNEITLGADKGYDTTEFVRNLKANGVIPHIARNETAHRSSAVPQEIAATPGYATSIRFRKRIEQVFGWIKLAGCLRQVKLRGLQAVSSLFHFSLAAYNLVRLQTILHGAKA